MISTPDGQAGYIQRTSQSSTARQFQIQSITSVIVHTHTHTGNALIMKTVLPSHCTPRPGKGLSLSANISVDREQLGSGCQILKGCMVSQVVSEEASKTLYYITLLWQQ